MMTKKQATAAGTTLLLLLKGNQWKIRVWENQGWHYSAYTKNLAVHSAGEGQFYCLVGEGGMGCCIWSSGKPHKNPNIAVESSMLNAKLAMTYYLNLFHSARQQYE